MKERLVVRLRRQANPEGLRRQWLSKRARMRLNRMLRWFDWVNFESVPKFTVGLAVAFVVGISFGIAVTAAIVELSSPSGPVTASVNIASSKDDRSNPVTRTGQKDTQVAVAPSGLDKETRDPGAVPGTSEAPSSGPSAPAVAPSASVDVPPVMERSGQSEPTVGAAPEAMVSSGDIRPAGADRPVEKPTVAKPTPEAPPSKGSVLALADRPRMKPAFPKPAPEPQPLQGTTPAVAERAVDKPVAAEPAPAPQPLKETPAAVAERPVDKPAAAEPAPAPQPLKETPAAVAERPVDKPVAAEPAPAPQPVKETPAAIAERAVDKPVAAEPAPAPQPVKETPAVVAERPVDKPVVAKSAPTPQPLNETPPAVAERAPEKTIVATSGLTAQPLKETPPAVAERAMEKPVVATPPPPKPKPLVKSRATAMTTAREPTSRKKDLRFESVPTLPTDTAPDDAHRHAAGATRTEAEQHKSTAPSDPAATILAAVPSGRDIDTTERQHVAAPSLILPKSTSEGSTNDAVPPTLWQDGGEVKPLLKDRRHREDRVASLPPRSEMPWVRNAVKTPHLTGDAMVAIVIDDMGIAQLRTRRAIELPAPLTMAFIPYGFHLRELTRGARDAGHEVLVHLPMEPLDPEINPGPNALFTGLPLKEIERRIKWNLDRFNGYVGVNNHMGSRFTAWPAGMELLMREVRSRGLLFLDSWTNNRSMGLNLSREYKVPNAIRDVFIDHDIARDAIQKRLGDLERIARRRGFAVGIGHPHELTREILSKWIPAARSRGIDFVPISAIVRRRMKSG